MSAQDIAQVVILAGLLVAILFICATIRLVSQRIDALEKRVWRLERARLHDDELAAASAREVNELLQRRTGRINEH